MVLKAAGVRYKVRITAFSKTHERGSVLARSVWLTSATVRQAIEGGDTQVFLDFCLYTICTHIQMKASVTSAKPAMMSQVALRPKLQVHPTPKRCGRKSEGSSGLT